MNFTPLACLNHYSSRDDDGNEMLSMAVASGHAIHTTGCREFVIPLPGVRLGVMASLGILEPSFILSFLRAVLALMLAE